MGGFPPIFGNTHMFSGFSFFAGSQTHPAWCFETNRTSRNWPKGFLPWGKLWKSMVVEIRLCKNIKGLLPVWHSRLDWRCVSNISDGLDFSDWRQIPLQISRLSFFLICLSTPFGQSLVKNLLWRWSSQNSRRWVLKWGRIIAKEKVRYLQGDYHSDWQHHWGASPSSTPSQLWLPPSQLSLLKTQSDDFSFWGPTYFQGRTVSCREGT